MKKEVCQIIVRNFPVNLKLDIQHIAVDLRKSQQDTIIMLLDEAVRARLGIK